MPSEHDAIYTVFSKPPVFADLFNQYKRSHPHDADWPTLVPATLRKQNTYWLLKHPNTRPDARQTLVLMEDKSRIYLLALESFQDKSIPFFVWHWDMALDGYKDQCFINPQPTWHRKPHSILVCYLGTEAYTSSRKFTDAMRPQDLPLNPALEAKVELYVNLASLTDQTEAENAAYQTELRELAEALRLAHGKSRAEPLTLVRTHPLFQDMDADVARLLAELLHVAEPVGDEGARRLNLAQGEELAYMANSRACPEGRQKHMEQHPMKNNTAGIQHTSIA